MPTTGASTAARITAIESALTASTSIADVLAANGRNSHFARREEVLTILTALRQSPKIAVGKLDGDFRNLPDNWSSAQVTDQIFSDPQPVGAMMETLMRPTGEWSRREKARARRAVIS